MKSTTTFLGKELYVTCESDAYRLYSDGERIQVNAVGELESKQELYVTCESDAYRLYSDGERIQVNAVGELESKQELYVTCESDAYRLYSDGERIQVNAVGELKSKQEEVDTKVFLCSKFANEIGFGSVRIITVDSDVAILALYYQQQLSVQIYLEYVTGEEATLSATVLDVLEE